MVSDDYFTLHYVYEIRAFRQLSVIDSPGYGEWIRHIYDETGHLIDAG